MNHNIRYPGIKAWLEAARLRTLPLAAAAVGMGNLLHFGKPGFRMVILFLSILTTVFLQVLSNFANDLGDSENGADNEARKGPERMVQSGAISRESMRIAVMLFAFLSLLSGVFLLWFAFRQNLYGAIPLFAAGLFSIAAAWFYTNGSRPYGYSAMGDPAVFLFFGLLAVLGTAWLQVQEFNWQFLFPAFALGCWSTAVLNLNNMRDIASDALAGKRTIPMIFGKTGSRVYHTGLVAGGAICLVLFGLKQNAIWIAGAIPGFFVMLRTLPVVLTKSDENSLDGLLKPQAIGTFLAVLGMALVRIFFS